MRLCGTASPGDVRVSVPWSQAPRTDRPHGSVTHVPGQMCYSCPGSYRGKIPYRYLKAGLAPCSARSSFSPRLGRLPVKIRSLSLGGAILMLIPVGASPMLASAPSPMSAACHEMVYEVFLGGIVRWGCPGDCVGSTGSCNDREGTDATGTYNYCACDLTSEESCCYLIHRKSVGADAKGDCGGACPGDPNAACVVYTRGSGFEWSPRTKYFVECN